MYKPSFLFYKYKPSFLNILCRTKCSAEFTTANCFLEREWGEKRINLVKSDGSVVIETSVESIGADKGVFEPM
jgi:hypothetical protein